MKKFIKISFYTIFILFVLVAGIHIISSFTLDRIIQYKEISFASPKISPALNGYVIAFIADTHDIPPEKLMQVVEKVNARNVDLLLLGGDYVWHDSDRTMRIFSQIKTKDGCFGVEGNHDSFKDLASTMPKYGFTFLVDEGLYIKPGFYLGGVTFFGGDKLIPSIKDAIAGSQPNDFVLLLAHNPDIVQLQDSSKVDLALAGHTHGGQVTFFGLWAPALKYITLYGHKFKSGWADTRYGSKVFVSRGVGTSGNSNRVFARPQIIFVTLKTL